MRGSDHVSFIASASELADSVDQDTLACFVTFPDNPFQSTWQMEDASELAALVEKCQELGVVLIADNIFQDLRWTNEPIPEIFSVTPNNRGNRGIEDIHIMALNQNSIPSFSSAEG